MGSIFISSCNKDVDCHEPKFDKTLILDRVLTISHMGGAIRALNITSSDPTETGAKTLTIDWASDTWNNDTNKPKLVVLVNGNLAVIDADKYSYNKGVNGGMANITLNKCPLTYSTDNDVITFYLYDKSFPLDQVNKKIAFSDDFAGLLNPLNDATATPTSIRAIFEGSTTIAALKNNNAPVNFTLNPLGTLFLFDMPVAKGQTRNIYVSSSNFRFSGELDLIDGYSNTSGAYFKKLTLNGGSKSRSVYAVYGVTISPAATSLTSTITITGFYYSEPFKSKIYYMPNGTPADWKGKVFSLKYPL